MKAGMNHFVVSGAIQWQDIYIWIDVYKHYIVISVIHYLMTENLYINRYLLAWNI
jgi:hypothetical protein